MSENKPLRRTIRGGRPFFFQDPATDKVLTMVVTLASEVWALRERLAAMESLSVGRGTLRAGEVDEFEFAPADEQRLAADRKEFIENLFRVLQEHAEAVAARARQPAARTAAAPRKAARKPAGKAPRTAARAGTAAVRKQVSRKPARRKVLARSR
jgi:hypothetical protein